MIDVPYRREVPYSQAVVLSQYFDLEHLEHVHPRSFGRARMVAKERGVIVWDLEWPPVLGLFRVQSRIRQEFTPPWGIRAVITRGLLSGTETVVQLDKTETGTLVIELHRIALPGWRWLRGFVQRTLVRRLDWIWEEDLAVKVCRGGWPGVPLVEHEGEREASGKPDIAPHSASV
ncbi:MAG: hypothetical protein IT391_01345 [Nitrospira sp.]|nr:hypothetical protein [Nitrospira sp.]